MSPLSWGGCGSTAAANSAPAGKPFPEPVLPAALWGGHGAPASGRAQPPQLGAPLDVLPLEAESGEAGNDGGSYETLNRNTEKGSFALLVVCFLGHKKK